MHFITKWHGFPVARGETLWLHFLVNTNSTQDDDEIGFVWSKCFFSVCFFHEAQQHLHDSCDCMMQEQLDNTWPALSFQYLKLPLIQRGFSSLAERWFQHRPLHIFDLRNKFEVSCRGKKCHSKFSTSKGSYAIKCTCFIKLHKSFHNSTSVYSTLHRNLSSFINICMKFLIPHLYFCRSPCTAEK